MTNFILGFLACAILSWVAFVFQDRIRLAMKSKLKRAEEKLNPPKS